MLDVSEAEGRAAALIEAALKAGADAADVLYIGDASTAVQVRLGELEDVTRSEGEEIGLRFFVGQRSARAPSSDLSFDALAALVAGRAMALRRRGPGRPRAGRSPARAPRPTSRARRRRSLPVAPGAGARSRNAAPSRDRNSEGAGVSAGRTVVALATSQGRARHDQRLSGLSSVIAGTGSGMQRDYASHSTRHYRDLDGPEAIGRLAGERAVKRLDPGKLASGTMPIVFDPRVGGSLIGSLLGALSGPAIARKTSFLLGREEEDLFDPAIIIVDDPHRRRGLRSKPFDGEGVATQVRRLVEGGRLTRWLLNSASARQLARDERHANRGDGPPGGRRDQRPYGARTAQPGLIADIARVYVTEMIGSAVNPVTGDYSPRRLRLHHRQWRDRGAGRRDHHRRQSDRHVRAMSRADDLEHR